VRQIGHLPEVYRDAGQQNIKNAQLFHKLSHSYMLRHYRVILRELTINTLPRYTSISQLM
jgi:hypothetical protein